VSSKKIKKKKVQSQKTKKFDSGKAMMSMIPQEALLEVARSFTHGAKKYGEFNYSLGIEYTRMTDAALRHINKALRGLDFDEDSGQDKLYHLANAVASLMILLDGQILKIIKDNRNGKYVQRILKKKF